MKSFFKTYIFSLDFIIALLFGITAFFGFAREVSNELAKDLYLAGITVLSIIFSVYFAALAIIISSSDDSFVRFLEEVGDYTRIINTFRFTLFSIFTSLSLSIILYFITSTFINDKKISQPSYLIVAFVFMFTYSLISAIGVTSDAISYAKLRSVFLLKTKDNKPD